MDGERDDCLERALREIHFHGQTCLRIVLDRSSILCQHVSYGTLENWTLFSLKIVTSPHDVWVRNTD